MFDAHLRTTAEKGLNPIGAALAKAGVSANFLTIVGLTMAVVSAIVIGAGHLRWGVLVMAAAGIPDLLDGAVAKTTGTASKRGAFFDSSIDRVSDSLILGGISWYLAAQHPGNSAIVILPYALLATSLITSYLRSKGEQLGFDAKGGIMERAERLIVIGAALLFNKYLVAILAVMLVLTTITVIQRFFKVWNQATKQERLEQNN